MGYRNWYNIVGLFTLLTLSSLDALSGLSLHHTRRTSTSKTNVSSRREWLQEMPVFLAGHIAASTACATLLLILDPHVALAGPLDVATAATAAGETSLQSSETIIGASGNSVKPYAPTSALLPATRCKLWLDNAQEITTNLATADTKQTQFEHLQKLDDVLQNRPLLFRGEKPLTRTPSSAMAQITVSVSGANKLDSRNNRRDLNTNFGTQLAAILNQADVERQWGMLQYSESQRERSNELRAALNYYTQQLEFDGDRYLLTASKEDRKRMIRNDQLPTLTAVITSDLDLRDLYRNQFLTAIEDAKAEAAYQVKQSPESVEIDDVVDLMKQASTAFGNWFDLIDSTDVREAIEAVRSE